MGRWFLIVVMNNWLAEPNKDKYFMKNLIFKKEAQYE